MRIAIVGAGMAGLACAEGLIALSTEIVLFDKGGRPGGRVSTRITPTDAGGASFDHGAPRFQARDSCFQMRLEPWRAAGLVARWPGSARAQAGQESWVGVPGMSAPLAAMADAFTVHRRTRIDTLTRHGGGWHLGGSEGPAFDAIVVAVPAEQVAPLVAAHDEPMAARARAVQSEPCWTLMASFSARLPIEADMIEQSGAIGLATRDSAKPGRSGPEAWTIQATADWSRDHLEDDASRVAAALLDVFARAAGITLPRVLSAQAHRWRYARPSTIGSQDAVDDGFLWNAELGLGVCGDWLLGSEVESAWRSGTGLAHRMRGDG
jgi:predicted NAD/FAD-dependent oxidoreductase